MFHLILDKLSVRMIMTVVMMMMMIMMMMVIIMIMITIMMVMMRRKIRKMSSRQPPSLNMKLLIYNYLSHVGHQRLLTYITVYLIGKEISWQLDNWCGPQIFLPAVAPSFKRPLE